jgi:hypothetical protein
MTTTDNHLAAELLAVADALRSVCSQLCQLVHADHPAVAGQPEARLVLVEGLDVAAALEVIAQRLGASRDQR